MLEQPLQPAEQDVVLGGRQAVPTDAAVLGRASHQERPYSFHFTRIEVNKQGIVTKQETRSHQGWIQSLTSNIVLEMAAIPGGTFLMGAPESAEVGFYPNFQHRATVAPFFISRYPITQAQWLAIATTAPIHRSLALNPAYFPGRDRPIERVSWYDAMEFCDRLSRQTGRAYRLPTETEWEYACRAGTYTPFHIGENLTPKWANYNGNYDYYSGSSAKGLFRQETTPVGSFDVANAYGLFDMHGNVWEWCDDRHPSEATERFDLKYPQLLRGGSWATHPKDCHASARCSLMVAQATNDVGFRVCCSAP
jgi:formylglycine-generating enzyme required for sulfatase activity